MLEILGSIPGKVKDFSALISGCAQPLGESEDLKFAYNVSPPRSSRTGFLISMMFFCPYGLCH